MTGESIAGEPAREAEPVREAPDATGTLPDGLAASGPLRSVPQRWRDPLLVGIVALALRVVWVAFMSRPPTGLSDPAIYRAAADQIADGLGYRTITGTVTAYYPPGYPFFLGAVEWLVKLVGLDSHFVLIVGLVQALLGAATAALVVVIARQMGGGKSIRKVAVVAGMLVALWPNLIAHSSLFLSETLFLAVFTLTFALLVKATAEGLDLPMLASSAVLLGVATLIRPQSALLLIPAIVIALLVARTGFRPAATTLGALAIGVVLVVTPWSIRNTLAMDGLVIVSTNTGDNLCIGFNPDASGGFGMDPKCQTETSYTDGPVEERLRNTELRRRATTWALDHPGALGGLAISKLRTTFRGDHDSIRALEAYGADQFLTDSTRTFLNSAWDAYYFLVATLALGGVGVMILTTGVRERFSGHDGAVRTAVILVVLFGALVPVVSFGDERFKVPLTPFLAILAAVAIGEVSLRLAQRREPSRTATEGTTRSKRQTVSHDRPG